jgi:tetratricopeptide (TPR) repeat protein
MSFQFGEANRDLQRARRLGWPPEVCNLETLLIQAKAGYFNKVEPSLRAVFLSKATVDPEVNAALAKGYVERYKFYEALICLNDWMAISPNDVRPYLWRVEIYERQPDAEKNVLDDCLKVVSLDSNHYGAHFKAAQTFFKLAQFEQAEQYYARCLELRPKDADARVGLAKCAESKGKEAEAAALIEQILELQPRHAAALRELAQIDLANNRVGLAVERLRMSIEQDASDQVAYYYLWMALHRLGDKGGAEEALRVVQDMRETAGKLEALRDKIGECPTDIAAIQEIVELYQKHGNHKNAARWARIALELDPQNHAAQDSVKQYRQSQGL